MFAMQAETGQYEHAEQVKLGGGEAQKVKSVGEIAASPISRPKSPQMWP
jgi:hypothetical protein